jgi:hypothetical protein
MIHCPLEVTTVSSVIQTQTSTLNVNVNDLQIVYSTSCVTPFFGTNAVFNLTCYGPTNFSNLTSPSNFTLYGCPLTCFSTMATDIEQISIVPQMYVSLLTNSSNITYYYLSSYLFPNYVLQCIEPCKYIE